MTARLSSLVSAVLTSSLLGSALVINADASAASSEKKLPKKNSLHRAASHHTLHALPSGGHEDLIVTGTREFGKKARDAIAPVDVVSSKQLARTGQPTLRDALQLLLPSLTVPTGGFDTGALTDSISLRGLSSNETLVLVDGHRRHTTANIYADTGPQQGTTPTDIDMIPMSSIDHIEVLRDGASAQYGSDAVAGVVNIILKKQSRGLTMRSNSGITSDGDGYQQGLFLDGGFNLNNRGFIHIGGDFVHQDHAFRSAPDSRTGTTINKILSQPEQTRESIAINAGYDITNTLQAYATATYAHRHAEAFQNYRLPSALTAYPGYEALYPDGYSPLQTNEENDFEVTAGLKGKLLGWHWDLSSVYGRDFDNIGLKQDANTALYKATGKTPQKFNNVQGYNNSQWTSSFDLSRKIHLSIWPHSINLAGGASYRYESYSIATGSPDSTYNGGTSLALSGTNSQNAGNFNRDVVAGYVDIATHLTKNWQVDAAGRYEHYTDVGNTQTGKISTRYDITKRFALRGTFSNGFHAPTLPQEHYSALTISPTVARGLIAANSPGALAHGATRLKAEQSTNIEGGIIAEPIKKLNITVDAYQIDLRGRILPGGNQYGSTAASILTANGFQLPAGISGNNLSTQWFANVANTRTQGLDIIAHYPTDFGRFGHVNWDVSINLNRTRLRHQATRDDGSPLLNPPSVAYITTAYPRSKMIFGGNWFSPDGNWTVSLHEIRYGQTTSQLTYYKNNNTSTASTTNYLQFHNKPKWTTNLSVSYAINRHWNATLGGNNIFAAYPSKTPKGNRYLGVPKYYMSTSQLGINGGYYYVDVTARF
ncbi:TonB-dependent receptor [Saccharibacter sp. 17.LH.SD]|uniref:TonB-dependent receptor plug domain-containing protein n=1 Tax=Saccharibacter sp. 17.LH.SD TaxID=2689393 RepID=UPI001370D5D7|nr:TonB-dependent receptor [Saccharibacter sp. 17.LH.SD]MXV44858.1 TonB-dependent receptor [Saccharibacter sp. 17.LH.SD]